jgi:hypothetical protein
MPAWWNAELSELLTRKRYLLRLSFPTANEQEEAQTISTRLKKLCKLRSREYWSSVCSRIGREIRQGGKELRSAWRTLSSLIKPKAPRATAEPDPYSVAELWSSLWSSKNDETEYADYLNWRNNDEQFSSYRPSNRADSDFVKPFTSEDVHHAIKSMKDNKAADIDGIVNEVLKKLPNLVVQKLAESFTDLAFGKSYPENWTKALVILLFKSGDPTSAGNYRPITL